MFRRSCLCSTETWRGVGRQLHAEDGEAWRGQYYGLGLMAASGVGRLYKVVDKLRHDQYIGILQNTMLPSMSDLFGDSHAIFMIRIQNTQLELRSNGLTAKSFRFWSGPRSPQTSIPLKICGKYSVTNAIRWRSGQQMNLSFGKSARTPGLSSLLTNAASSLSRCQHACRQ